MLNIERGDIMATRFKRIIEVADALVGLDTQGRVWCYEPSVEITQSPWRRLIMPGEGDLSEDVKKSDIGPMFGNR
jgi:hypothetical protein